jgi:glycosyltransferase involved in cell wall biosynthesis
VRVAFYYGTYREPNDQTNPYGNLLADALARQGVEVEYVLDHDAAWLRANADRFDLMHWHWPSHEYVDPESRAETERRMAQFVDELRLARELGWRIVWTAHNLYPHNRTFFDVDVEFRQRFVELVTAIISHCDAAADAVRREFRPQAPMFVIPHGNFIDVLPPTVTREQERGALGIAPDDFVYGFIGNLLPYKGLEELIDAFVETDDGHSWLLISGGTRPREYGASIVARAAGHPRIVVRPYDYAPGEAFVQVLEASEIIVLPFRASTTSGSLVQALSWPRPCIVPNMGCLPTQMDADAGILYPPDADGALARALVEARSLDLGAARDAAWRSAVRADWDDIARRTIEAYRA